MRKFKFRILFYAFVFLVFSAPVSAAGPQRVRDLEIELYLLPSGGVVFHERWDLDTGNDITEWYLVRGNLGDIEVFNLRVFEKGQEFTDIGEWDVDRTLSQKAGKSGIVHKTNGVELCWGVGSHGDHVFDVYYSMVNALKSLNDYDMLHLQLVSDGLSSPPEHVKVTIEAQDTPLDTLNARIWMLGCEGTSAFEDGKVVLESTEPLRTDDSVIALLRLDKGIVTPLSVQERDFQEALDQALVGASFADDEEGDPIAGGIATFFALLFMYLIFVRPIIKVFTNERKQAKRRRSSILGTTDVKKVPWFRDIPMGKDLGMADLALNDIGEEREGNNLALSVILRLVHKGFLKPTREMQGSLELAFTGKDPTGLDPIERAFYQMLQDAAGEDKTLQDKEFSDYARRYQRKVEKWADDARDTSRAQMEKAGWYRDRKYTDSGKQEVRNVAGLWNFLNTFTLSKERETADAVLWKEYLVYAALFGIADKVATQLKDIDPKFFKEVFNYDVSTLPSLLSAGRSLSRAVQIASIASTYRPSSSSSYSGRSRSGYGGRSSRGGGGGFSGGGRGGGGR